MAKKGVKVGYIHDWKYLGHWREKKLKPGLWRVEFNATKGRSGRTGGPRIRTKIKWGFKNVQQTATKIAPKKYQTRLTAIKYLKKIRQPKYRGKY